MLNQFRQFFGLPIPHRHEWEPWVAEDVVEHKVFASPGEMPIRVERVIIQKRVCTTCHYTDYDVERFNI